MIHMIHRPLAITIAVAVLGVGLGACSSRSLAPSSADISNLPAEQGFGQFTDIPVPKGADMDADHSLVLGAREAWVGRLVMSVSDRPSTMYDFYARQMPGFGWRPVTSVRGDVSTMTFQRGDRIATIQLRPGSLWGSEVWLTMSPQHGEMPANAAGLPGTVAAPGALRADERIRSSPLR